MSDCAGQTESDQAVNSPVVDDSCEFIPPVYTSQPTAAAAAGCDVGNNKSDHTVCSRDTSSSLVLPSDSTGNLSVVITGLMSFHLYGCVV